MPTENKRRFPGNDARRDAAMSLAQHIETLGNRGRQAFEKLTCSVRDDSSSHIIFVDERITDGRTTNLATVNVYAPGKARAHGRFSDNRAIVESLEWFKKNVTG